MKKVVIALVLAGALIGMTGCVSTKKYNALKSELDGTKLQLADAEAKLIKMEDALKESEKSQAPAPGSQEYESLEQVKYQLILNESELRTLKSKLDETEKQLNMTKSQLNEAREEIVRVKIQAAQARLSKAKKDLAEAEKEVMDAKKEIDSIGK